MSKFEHEQNPDWDLTHRHDHDAPVPENKVMEFNGKRYFSSIEELTSDTEGIKRLHDEFPQGAAEIQDESTRRDFLKLMGASVGLAGLTGCVRRPKEELVPYRSRPELLVPGLPQFFATTMVRAGEAVGLVVEAHEGRPTKIEGNKLHPASGGAACTYEQGAILGLYDPDRIVQPLNKGAPATKDAFNAFLDERIAAFKGNGGQGLVILHDRNASPTFAALAAKVKAALPQARIVEWEAISDDAAYAAGRIAFGEPLFPLYNLTADTVLAVDADLFGEGPFRMRYANDWASRRDPDGKMSRLYVAEPFFTGTGASADHRVRIRREEAGPFLRVLAAQLVANGVELPAGIAAASDGGFDKKFVAAVAKELAQKKHKGIVAVGTHQPAEVQAIAMAINAALSAGSDDVKVAYQRPQIARDVSHVDGLRSVVEALNGKSVDTLIVLGGNPVYDAPADLGFAQAFAAATHSVVFTEGKSETAAVAEWAVPRAHFLEAWGDAVSHDGTYSIVQPLIEPIWGGLSDVEVLGKLAGEKGPGRDLVKANFKAAGRTDLDWDRALHDGVLPGTPVFVTNPSLLVEGIAQALTKVPETAPAATASDLELSFIVDNKVFDGRYANNGWLQELPDPITKLCWSNALLVSPALAASLGIENRDRVKLEVGGASVEAGAYILPGTADHSVAIALGYGRTVAGRIGDGQGTNAYPLRTTKAMDTTRGAKVTKLVGKAMLVTQQPYGQMEGRPIVREGTVDDYRENPTFAREMVQHPPLLALWKDHEYKGQQWGMTIDLNSCVGCNGCMIACQAENNIPIVGAEQVQNGRWMYWIRLDRYFSSTSSDPDNMNDVEVVHQPLGCMHCENAPCENVCPVAATVHAPDGGTNDMVYNRCIGTRYCANNCPYKVRRFNFFDWHQQGRNGKTGGITEVERLKFNPDVSVRTRGVMEKCSYCLQRVHSARRAAKLGGAEVIPDGGVVPACAQACPTEAIVFGDINDPQSKVTKAKKNPRNYELLAELNTKPRTSYLAKVRNPNPELA